jgi:radical SAM superfamily enzyme YgiQ (UPF0313 family)
VEEMKMLMKDYGINYFAFADELLMSSVERTVDICEGIIKADLGDIKWECAGRLNYAAREPEMMHIMKKAGCIFINYGIEAMDDAVLANMKKGLRVDMVYAGIDATLASGITPRYNIIFGNIGDNRETLDTAVKFLLQYDEGEELRTIRPVTPYPGTPLYYDAIERGLLKDCEDFYENKHTNSDLLAVNFTELSDDEFHEALMEANVRLLDNYYEMKKQKSIDQAQALYLEQNAAFRGWRQT